MGPSRTPFSRVFPCPRRLLGQTCPRCEQAFELIKTGNERQGKDMLPNYQMFMNVLLFDKGGEPVRTKAGDIEVKVWGPSRKVLDDIFEFVAERENEAKALIDISDPEEGYLVKVKRTGRRRSRRGRSAPLLKFLIMGIISSEIGA